MRIVAADASHWARRLAGVHLFGYRMSSHWVPFALSHPQANLRYCCQVLPGEPYSPTKQQQRLFIGTGISMRIAAMTREAQIVN
jgi:hypothetical protein